MTAKKKQERLRWPVLPRVWIVTVQIEKDALDVLDQTNVEAVHAELADALIAADEIKKDFGTLDQWCKDQDQLMRVPSSATGAKARSGWVLAGADRLEGTTIRIRITESVIWPRLKKGAAAGGK